MAQKRKGTVKKLHPYRTSKHKKLKVGRENLSPLLKKMWSRLFVTKADGRNADEEEIKIGDLLPYNLKPTQMPICGVNLKTQLKSKFSYIQCTIAMTAATTHPVCSVESASRIPITKDTALNAQPQE